MCPSNLFEYKLLLIRQQEDNSFLSEMRVLRPRSIIMSHSLYICQGLIEYALFTCRRSKQ